MQSALRGKSFQLRTQGTIPQKDKVPGNFAFHHGPGSVHRICGEQEKKVFLGNKAGRCKKATPIHGSWTGSVSIQAKVSIINSVVPREDSPLGNPQLLEVAHVGCSTR